MRATLENPVLGARPRHGLSEARGLRKVIGRLVVLSVLLEVPAGSASEEGSTIDPRRSVVRVVATQREPNLMRPWLRGNAPPAAGTGVVVEGGRILTNSHIVSYADPIYVQPYGSSETYRARTVAMAHYVDLALLEIDLSHLEPEDAETVRSLPALELAAGLPRIGDTLTAYGYSVGGLGLAATTGTVSRIEYGVYEQGGFGLQVQTTATLNPGSSGGPAVADGQLVGLAFAVLVPGQSVGFLVPAEEIRTFLEDIEDGKYDGKLGLRDHAQTLENPALRSKLGLGPETKGILVHTPCAEATTSSLQRGDIITGIGDHEIDNAGMVTVAENLRLSFHYLVPKLARDKRVRLTVLREGRSLEVDAALYLPEENLVLQSLKNTEPPYLVWGPLAFSVATRELVDTLGPYLGELWSIQESPLLTRRYDVRDFEGEELVVVTTMFPHDMAKGYENPTSRIVRCVDGVRVRNLRHLAEVLHDGSERYVEFELAGKFAEDLVFDRSEVEAAMTDILAQNAVPPQACSVGLRDLATRVGEVKVEASTPPTTPLDPTTRSE